MPNPYPRVKRQQGKHLHKPPSSVKILVLFIHLVGLLIFIMQQPEIREILQLLLKGRL